MGLFDTHFVQFGQVLPISGLKLLVSGLKLLVTSIYVQVVKSRTSGKITSVPTLFSEHLHQMKNKHQIMNVHIKWDYLIPILSSLVKYYVPISGLKLLVTSIRYVYIARSGKITTEPKLFSEHLHQMKNKHQIMNVHM